MESNESTNILMNNSNKKISLKNDSNEIEFDVNKTIDSNNINSNLKNINVFEDEFEELEKITFYNKTLFNNEFKNFVDNNYYNSDNIIYNDIKYISEVEKKNNKISKLKLMLTTKFLNLVIYNIRGHLKNYFKFFKINHKLYKVLTNLKINKVNNKVIQKEVKSIFNKPIKVNNAINNHKNENKENKIVNVNVNHENRNKKINIVDKNYSNQLRIKINNIEESNIPIPINDQKHHKIIKNNILKNDISKGITYNINLNGNMIINENINSNDLKIMKNTSNSCSIKGQSKLEKNNSFNVVDIKCTNIGNNIKSKEELDENNDFNDVVKKKAFEKLLLFFNKFFFKLSIYSIQNFNKERVKTLLYMKLADTQIEKNRKKNLLNLLKQFINSKMSKYSYIIKSIRKKKKDEIIKNLLFRFKTIFLEFLNNSIKAKNYRIKIIKKTYLSTFFDVLKESLNEKKFLREKEEYKKKLEIIAYSIIKD